MFCEKCGAKNDSSNNFCEKCGNKLEAEVKKTKSKTGQNENTTSIKDKFNALSKKQKIIGGLVLTLIVIVVVLYNIGLKMTSLETLGSKAFEELATKSKIDNKYLSIPLDSKEYFVSLADYMENTIEDKEIGFEYDKYVVTAGKKKITVKYLDKNDDVEYKVIFNIKQDGKTLLFYDKYVITKVTIENKENYKSIVLYDPKNTQKLTLTTTKGSKISIDDKEISNSYINSKKSNDEIDVYEIKGIATGNYDVQFTLGKLAFKKTVYIYSSEENEYDLTNYISSSYLTDDSKDYEKEFKTYISTYYEYVNDENKTVEEFDKKYKVTDDIKKTFEDSKSYASQIASFKVDEVTLRSLYYYSSDKELSVTYKVNYTYKYNDSELEKTSYDTVRVTYDLSNPEIPKSLNYMPY